jgi:putative transposase
VAYPRIAPDGFIQHVVNRGDHRETILHKPQDFRAFLGLMSEATEHVPMRILSYCVMRNHFHLVLWPFAGKDLSAYMQWLMNAQIRIYLSHYPPASPGHIYQGRFKNSLVQSDVSLLNVMRYVEANPVAAGIVQRAEHYKWSSASTLVNAPGRPRLTDGPVAKPANWLEWVNSPAPEEELHRIRTSIRRGAPYGADDWVQHVAAEHNLLHTIRKPGRPPLCETMVDGEVVVAADVATLP